jgi:SNF2 family DNA or RNA helicase
MRVLDPGLMQSIAASDDADKWLILEEHPDFPGAWVAQCLDPNWILDFPDLLSARAVTPAGLKGFLDRANSLDYEVAFGEPPTSILSVYERLNDEPTVELASPLEGTTKGFLPYQVNGFNFLKDLHSGVAMWSTGTGKTVLASGLLKYHLEVGSFDYAWVVVKAHNKINTQRTLKRLADIDCLVLDGPQKRRHETLTGLLEAPNPTVVITNYEKFRIDVAHLLPLFEKRVLLIWDEMPTKLKSRNTRLYKAIRKLLYKKVDMSVQRPQELRQYMLSATPIENGPEDWYNCVRLLDPKLYGTVKHFRDDYVSSYNPFSYEPSAWKNLDRMGLKAAHITHQVDKSSPDISAQFPQTIEEQFFIDWDKSDRAVYDLLAEEAKKSLIDREFFENGIFGLIAAMQMMCCAPSMVSNSAALREAYEEGWGPYAGSDVALKLQKLLTRRLTDDKHTKIETLRQLLTEEHPDEKVVLFSSFNDTLHPILEKFLNDWNVPYVRYSGSPKQKQIAQDYFCNEDFVRVFLSSDQGSDSLNLEQASVVINYDPPWKWSTKTQRQNRIHRVTSGFQKVRFYDLLMADSVEERKLKVISKKKGYHEGVFKGAISEQSESARMSHDDLLYIIGMRDDK